MRRPRRTLRRLRFREFLDQTGLLMLVQLAAVCTKFQKPLFLYVRLLFFLLCFFCPQADDQLPWSALLSQASAMRNSSFFTNPPSSSSGSTRRAGEVPPYECGEDRSRALLRLAGYVAFCRPHRPLLDL